MGEDGRTCEVDYSITFKKMKPGMLLYYSTFKKMKPGMLLYFSNQSSQNVQPSGDTPQKCITFKNNEAKS